MLTRRMALAVVVGLAVAPCAQAATFVHTYQGPLEDILEPKCRILTIGGFPPEPNLNLDCLGPSEFNGRPVPGPPPSSDNSTASSGNSTSGGP